MSFSKFSFFRWMSDGKPSSWPWGHGSKISQNIIGTTGNTTETPGLLGFWLVFNHCFFGVNDSVLIRNENMPSCVGVVLVLTHLPWYVLWRLMDVKQMKPFSPKGNGRASCWFNIFHPSVVGFLRGGGVQGAGETGEPWGFLGKIGGITTRDP